MSKGAESPRRALLAALVRHTEALHAIAREQGEHQKLSDNEGAESGGEFSPYLDIEVFGSNVSDRAKAYLDKGMVRGSAPPSLLGEDHFARWFAEASERYPILCAYVVAMEHLNTSLEGELR